MGSKKRKPFRIGAPSEETEAPAKSPNSSAEGSDSSSRGKKPKKGVKKDKKEKKDAEKEKRRGKKEKKAKLSSSASAEKPAKRAKLAKLADKEKLPAAAVSSDEDIEAALAACAASEAYLAWRDADAKNAAAEAEKLKLNPLGAGAFAQLTELLGCVPEKVRALRGLEGSYVNLLGLQTAPPAKMLRGLAAKILEAAEAAEAARLAAARDPAAPAGE